MSDNKEDDPQYMMNKAKKEVIMNTLAKNGNECSCACMHTKRATMLTLALGSVRRSTCHTICTTIQRSAPDLVCVVLPVLR